MSMSAVAGPSKVNAMALECSLVAQTEIDACRAAGLQLVVWTVNEPAQMRYFIDLGIDGIITDRPDLLRHALT
jgi:glycerophosphoryl diester phosphodiesterase